MVDQSALFAHILSQTRDNIQFLAAHNQITQSDAQTIISKLPSASDASVLALADRTQGLMLAPTSPPPAPRMAPPSRSNVRARAIWGWNENAQVRNDFEHVGFALIWCIGCQRSFVQGRRRVRNNK